MPAQTGTRPIPVFRRSWFILCAVVVVSLLLALTAAVIISKVYWGFVFTPPAMDSRIAGAKAVRSLSRTYYDRELDRLTHYENYAGPPPVPRKQDRAYVREPYYRPRIRVLSSLERRGALSGPVPPVNDERLSTILPLVRESGHIVPDHGRPHHLASSRMHADVLELVGPNDEPLLVVVLSGGTVSNDHLPHYEFVFDDTNSFPHLLSVRQWYFDSAGLEWMTFSRIALALSIALLTLSVPPTAIVLLYRRFSAGGRVSKGLCPRCAYDLRADFSKGCSECGWGAGDARAGDRNLRQYRLRARLTRAASRPPGWRLAFLAGLGVLLVWFGASMPGGHPAALWFGHLLCIAASIVLVIKIIGFLTPNARRSQCRRHPLLRFGGLSAALLGTWVGESQRWPLRLRFELSRRSLDRYITTQRSVPAHKGQSELVGLYLCSIYETSDGANGKIVWVGGAGGRPLMRAFLWYPGTAPEEPRAYGHAIVIEPLGNNWYLWTYRREDE